MDQNKLAFFLAAMKAEVFRRPAWVISAFAVTDNDGESWKKEPYPYRIIRNKDGVYYLDPNQDNQPVLLSSVLNEPLFKFKDRVTINAGDVMNFTEGSIETSYGNILFNCTCFVYPFGKKIPYFEGKISARKAESFILDRLLDNPENVEDRVVSADPTKDPIYVDEYLKFTNAMFNLTAYTQLCVPACSPKSITPPPGVVELRTRLLEENKDKLHDPATIAKIDAVLIDYMKEYLKDDESMGFLTEKSFRKVRRKLYLMGGAEAGMNEGVDVELIPKSLYEGWDPAKFAIMNTASRAGSYSRGAQTELGGEATKWLFRASSNMTVTQEDCGFNDLGVEFLAMPGEEKNLIGFTALIKSGNTTVSNKITKENVGEYLGKVVTLRSPMYCKLAKTDFCKVCVGDRLGTNPTGLSTAVAEYGGVFLDILMSAMHGTELALAKMNYKKTMI